MYSKKQITQRLVQELWLTFVSHPHLKTEADPLSETLFPSGRWTKPEQQSWSWIPTGFETKKYCQNQCVSWISPSSATGDSLSNLKTERGQLLKHCFFQLRGIPEDGQSPQPSHPLRVKYHCRNHSDSTRTAVLARAGTLH
jgi:hypothetical protein